MNTSYFFKHGKDHNAVSIAAKAPDFYKGPFYKALAPSWSIFSEWKQTGNNNLYVKRYHEEILAKLSAEKVWQDLGDDAILLCWEAPGKFCHRKLVANWLLMELGVEVTEL